MHDDQHVVRLHLLSEAITQGSLYPRWVDGLGFGFGYPLFNFYPPLIYYISLFFHLTGFSLTTSIKLMIISGFIISAWGMYYLARLMFGKIASYTASILYIYFGYRAVLVYVRGALAEFYALAVLPIVFAAIIKLSKNPKIKYTIFYSFALALLLLTHPLVAAPSIIYILAFFIFYLAFHKGGKKFISQFVIGSVMGFGLSAFYWLPSQIERSYTMVDKILTREMANYLIHFVSPFQFWYSPWGWGGSIKGVEDGISFALGKVYIIFALASGLLALILIIGKKIARDFYQFIFLSALLLFSLFMTTDYSLPIWKTVKYLWYMQFPWRFLTFTTIFISLAAAYFIFFAEKLLSTMQKKKFLLYTKLLLAIFILTLAIAINLKYFKPQDYINASDQILTSKSEIDRISMTSFEFIPNQVLSNIQNKQEIAKTLQESSPTSNFQIISGQARINTSRDDFSYKEFKISADEQIVVRINTFYFPGWTGYLNGQKIQIQYDNPLVLMTLRVPSGQHTLTLKFENTSIRNLANFISITTSVSIIFLILQGSKFRFLKSLKKVS